MPNPWLDQSLSPGVELFRQRSVPHPHTFGEDDYHDDHDEDVDDDDDDDHNDGDANNDDDDETKTTMMTTLTTTRGRVVRELSTEQLGCRPRLQTEVLQIKHYHHTYHKVGAVWQSLQIFSKAVATKPSSSH